MVATDADAVAPGPSTSGLGGVDILAGGRHLQGVWAPHHTKGLIWVRVPSPSDLEQVLLKKFSHALNFRTGDLPNTPP